MTSNLAIRSDKIDPSKYIRWDVPGVVKIPAGEEDDIKAVAEQINTIQKTQMKEHRHMFSGTHARTQGIVKGKLVVGELPSYLAQTELFAKPGEFPIAIRYSTEASDPGIDDRVPQPRGFGMKIFDVEGDFFEAGKDLPTHDIEFNSAPALELADAKTTREIMGLRIKYHDDPAELQRYLSIRKDAELQKARDKIHNTHLSSHRHYSQTPYRFGDYVIKYSLTPSTETQKKQYSETVNFNQHANDVLSDWLKEFYENNDAEYLFQVQFLENLEEQPVEYAGAEWDEEKYPFQTVAKVIIPKQDSMIPARKTFWEDHIRLDPFWGLKSFEPIGGSNRLRKTVYPASAGLRHKTIGRKEINVTSIDQIPDSGYVVA